jgi:nitrite reductase/ring-hydroxylating ferredoxin subunit
MEASCPHLGASLSYAEIEDLEWQPDGIDNNHEPEKVIVCPWHRYVDPSSFFLIFYSVIDS